MEKEVRSMFKVVEQTMKKVQQKFGEGKDLTEAVSELEERV